MTFSIKTIKSRFDHRFIEITPTGWVESHGHLLGKLLKDPCTGKIYLRTNINVSNTDLAKCRMKFLSYFRYTQQLHCFNGYFKTFMYITELHGFRKYM